MIFLKYWLRFALIGAVMVFFIFLGTAEYAVIGGFHAVLDNGRFGEWYYNLLFISFGISIPYGALFALFQTMQDKRILKQKGVK